MMKVSKVFLQTIVVLAMLVGLSFPAGAALVNNGDGTITDTASELMWLQDLESQSIMSYADATIWADSLIFADYDDWRLPAGDPSCAWYTYCPTGEIGGLVDQGINTTTPGDFLLKSGWIWTGTLTPSDPTRAYQSTMVSGTQRSRGTGDIKITWAVRDIPVAPEPVSSTLFIIGGATLGLRRLRRRKP